MADRNEYDRREEEEEEAEFDETDYKAQKDAVLFAIDVSKSMMTPPEPSEDKKADKDSAVTAALKCAYQLMQQRIISNPKDMMGILLFNTEQSRFSDDEGSRGSPRYPHCYVYTDLDVPSADDVKKLKALVEEGEDADEILTPSKQKVSMAHMLFCANQILTTGAPNFGSRRLFIITDDDDPEKGDKSAQSQAATRAKDLYDLGVTIELFAITRGEQKFDLTKFYDDIIYRDPAADVALASDRITTAKSGTGLTLLNSLVSNVNSKQTPKRAYFSDMPFEIGPGLTISVKGYNVINRQEPARSCYIWLEGEKAQIAVGETARLAADSARTVEKGEVKKAYKFGGEYVYFSEEEQKTIKQFGSKVIRIIGFKERSQLKLWQSIKKSIFIYPSEEGFVGSTRVFTALWQKLLDSKKVGIAWHIARKNATPQLVAVIPSGSDSDEDSGTPFLPAGLWLYPLPWADDLREGPDYKDRPRTTEALTDKMHYIVKQLQLPSGWYNPSKYPNPALQWHYKILQALALEEEVPEQPEDATVPKYKAIHKRSGGYIEEWSQTADEILGDLKDKKAIKHDLEDEDERRPAKKAKAAASSAKADPDGDGISTAELKKMANKDELNKLKVPELKNLLVLRGLNGAGKKADLVERLEQWVEENA